MLLNGRFNKNQQIIHFNNKNRNIKRQFSLITLENKLDIIFFLFGFLVVGRGAKKSSVDFKS